LVEEAVDGSLELTDRPEDAAFEAPFGEFDEEAFDALATVTRLVRQVRRYGLGRDLTLQVTRCHQRSPTEFAMPLGNN
jgi:hypothetical protein